MQVHLSTEYEEETDTYRGVAIDEDGEQHCITHSGMEQDVWDTLQQWRETGCHRMTSFQRERNMI